MWLAYVIALLPVIAGAILWAKRDEVNLIEWVVASAIGFACAGIFHAVSIWGMTDDIETWSGRVTSATHHPYWHASWWETETYDCGTDKHPQTCTRLVHKTETHPEYWSVDVSYGTERDTYEISHQRWNLICEQFGVSKPRAVAGYRHDMDDGDANDYIADNHTGFVVPAHRKFHFRNNVKAAPSLFSYPSVPENQGFPYPEASDDWSRSKRLVGTAKQDFSTEAWDTLNAELGPTKKINLIAVGFGDKDSSAAHTLEAKWIGGKKNDVVICYGGVGTDGKPSWTYVFGWTESSIVKQNLQSIFLLSKPGDDLLPKVKEEVVANYKIKDWTKFDYLTVTPPGWAFLVLLLVMIATQVGFWFWGFKNEYTKSSGRNSGAYRYRPFGIRSRRSYY